MRRASSLGSSDTGGTGLSRLGQAAGGSWRDPRAGPGGTLGTYCGNQPFEKPSKKPLSKPNKKPQKYKNQGKTIIRTVWWNANNTKSYQNPFKTIEQTLHAVENESPPSPHFTPPQRHRLEPSLFPFSHTRSTHSHTLFRLAGASVGPPPPSPK